MCSDFVFVWRLLCFLENTFHKILLCSILYHSPTSSIIFTSWILLSFFPFPSCLFHFHAFRNFSFFLVFILHFFSFCLKLASVLPLISAHVHNYVHKWQRHPWNKEKLDANRCRSKISTFRSVRTFERLATVTVKLSPPSWQLRYLCSVSEFHFLWLLLVLNK